MKVVINTGSCWKLWGSVDAAPLPTHCYWFSLLEYLCCMAVCIGDTCVNVCQWMHASECTPVNASSLGVGGGGRHVWTVLWQREAKEQCVYINSKWQLSKINMVPFVSACEYCNHDIWHSFVHCTSWPGSAISWFTAQMVSVHEMNCWLTLSDIGCVLLIDRFHSRLLDLYC